VKKIDLLISATKGKWLRNSYTTVCTASRVAVAIRAMGQSFVYRVPRGGSNYRATMGRVLAMRKRTAPARCQVSAPCAVYQDMFIPFGRGAFPGILNNERVNFEPPVAHT